MPALLNVLSTILSTVLSNVLCAGRTERSLAVRFQRAHTRAQRQTSTARSRAKIASHSSSLSQRSPPPLAIVTARQGLGEQGEEGLGEREEGEKRGQERGVRKRLRKIKK